MTAIPLRAAIERPSPGRRTRFGAPPPADHERCPPTAVTAHDAASCPPRNRTCLVRFLASGCPGFSSRGAPRASAETPLTAWERRFCPAFSEPRTTSAPARPRRHHECKPRNTRHLRHISRISAIIPTRFATICHKSCPNKGLRCHRICRDLAPYSCNPLR